MMVVMRTTIEMKPEHRAQLLELAARRGDKGFSTVVAEAIDAFLQGRSGVERARKEALKVQGSFSAKETERLRREVKRIRSHWR